jgi:hypothetical protein
VKRKLFMAVSVVSLLLCVASVVMWVHSSRYCGYAAAGWLSNEGKVGHTLWATNYHGRFAAGYSWSSQAWFTDGIMVFPHGGLNYWQHDDYDTHGFDQDIDHWTTWRYTKSVDRSTAVWRLVLPIWVLCLTAAVPPAVQLFYFGRNRYRNERGHCPKCSYNLTGNTSGTCPECGTAVAGKVGASDANC